MWLYQLLIGLSLLHAVQKSVALSAHAWCLSLLSYCIFARCLHDMVCQQTCGLGWVDHEGVGYITCALPGVHVCCVLPTGPEAAILLVNTAVSMGVHVQNRVTNGSCLGGHRNVWQHVLSMIETA